MIFGNNQDMGILKGLWPSLGKLILLGYSSLIITIQTSFSGLKTYTGEVIKVKGLIDVDIIYNDQNQKVSLSLIVTLGEGPRSSLKPSYKTGGVYQPSDDQVVEKHSKQLFADGLQGMTTKFHIDKDATPKFRKARPVPYALKAKIETELSQLEHQGVNDKTCGVLTMDSSNCKGDETIRICGD